MNIHAAAGKVVHSIGHWLLAHSLVIDTPIGSSINTKTYPKLFNTLRFIGSLGTWTYHAVLGVFKLVLKVIHPVLAKLGTWAKAALSKAFASHPKLLAMINKTATLISEYKNVIGIAAVLVPTLAAGHHYRGHFHRSPVAAPVHVVNADNDVRVIFLKPDGSYAWTVLALGSAVKATNDSVTVTLPNGGVEHWNGSYILVPFKIASDYTASTVTPVPVVPKPVSKPITHKSH